MPQEHAHGVERTADPNIFANPVVVLAMWGPWLTGAAKCNSEIQEGLGALASEWQKFSGCRLEEDFALMQRLTQRPMRTRRGRRM